MIFLLKIFLLSIHIAPLFGALPPDIQKQKDKNKLLEFVEAHPKIKNSKYQLDLIDYTIRFDDCTVYFEREKINRPQGWVGPASDLIFKRSTCNLGKRIDDFGSELTTESYSYSSQDMENLEDITATSVATEEIFASDIVLEEYCEKIIYGQITSSQELFIKEKKSLPKNYKIIPFKSKKFKSRIDEYHQERVILTSLDTDNPNELFITIANLVNYDTMEKAKVTFVSDDEFIVSIDNAYTYYKIAKPFVLNEYNRFYTDKPISNKTCQQIVDEASPKDGNSGETDSNLDFLFKDINE